MAKILDFGLARRESDEDIRRTGTTVGTFAYMSPEQVKGSAIDKRSDVFSFGVVLYELILGRRPFRGEYAAEVAHKIVSEPPSAIDSVKQDAPVELLRIIGRCLEKNPVDRYQDIGQTLDDLRHFQRMCQQPTLTSGGQWVTGTETKGQAVTESAEFSQIPAHPLLPKKSVLLVAFVIAVIALVLLLSLPLRQYDGEKAITISPTEAEVGALDLLRREKVSTLGFEIYTFAQSDRKAHSILDQMGVSGKPLENFQSWGPTSWYKTVAVSADKLEKYTVLTTRRGKIFSYAHTFRPDMISDTLALDSLRYRAERAAERLLGVNIATLSAMRPSQSMVAGQMVTEFQWVSADSLPGSAQGELRVSFAGAELRSIGLQALFPEVLSRTAAESPVVAGFMAVLLTVLAAGLVYVTAIVRKVWSLPSWRAVAVVACPIVLAGIILFPWAGRVMIESESTSEVFRILPPTLVALFSILVSVIGAGVVCLTFMAAFGLLRLTKPTYLSGLSLAPSGYIGMRTLAISSAVGLVSAALVVVVRGLYIHTLLIVLGKNLLDSLVSSDSFGVRLPMLVDEVSDLVGYLGVIPLIIASTIVLEDQLRFGRLAWLITAMAWFGLTSGFFAMEATSNWVNLSNILFVTMVLFLVVRYSLLAGIMGAIGYDILRHGLYYKSFGTSYYQTLGWFWIVLWLLIATFSVYYVVGRMGAEAKSEEAIRPEGGRT